MKIEIYNGMYFQPIKVSVNRSRKDETSNQFDSEAFKLHQNKPKIPSIIELFQNSGNDITLFEETELQSKCVLHNDIIQSEGNKL